MRKYKVIDKGGAIIEANSKEEAIKKFFDVTDGTDYITTAKLIKKKKIKKEKKGNVRKQFNSL